MSEQGKNGITLALNLSHDSGAALFVDRKLVAAANEERYNRIKITRAFPVHSIESVLSIAGVNRKDITNVILGSKITPNWLSLLFNNWYMESAATPFPPMLYWAVLQQVAFRFSGLIDWEGHLVKRHVAGKLADMSIGGTLGMVEHHVSHSYSAYSSAPFDHSLVISLDGMGDGIGCMVSLGDKGMLKPVACLSGFRSPAWIYAAVTELLGYVRSKHEGKLTGLAAYGNPQTTEAIFRKIISFCNGEFRVKWINSSTHPAFLELMKYSPEDICAGLQYVFEDVIVQFLQFMMDRYGRRNLALSGGAFGNVKLNQRILEDGKADEIFIFPHMGDGGLAVGAGFAHHLSPPGSFSTAYLGNSYDDETIRRALDKAGLKYCYENDIEGKMAKLLAQGKVVGRFAGRMEFGPRALGNRSILASAHDKSINQWLNQKMKRTEFMPFAPSTLAEYADRYYITTKGAMNAARFMTITFNCTQESREKQPACVHIDNTARPQLVHLEDNPSYHLLISKYHALTGVPSILNTSFNVHEEPIVCTPDDAIKSYLQCGLDALGLERFLVVSGDTPRHSHS